MMHFREIRPIVTDFDHRRLRGLLRLLRRRCGIHSWQLPALESELDRAAVVRPNEVPPSVVTMNSRVQLLDARGRSIDAILVFPGAHVVEAQGVPILSTLGIALLGAREGDTLGFRTLMGARRFVIDKLLYQPEAAGDFAV
jgi:regulator of nucleoside diphosphate kinase